MAAVQGPLAQHQNSSQGAGPATVTATTATVAAMPSLQHFLAQQPSLLQGETTASWTADTESVSVMAPPEEICSPNLETASLFKPLLTPHPRVLDLNAGPPPIRSVGPESEFRLALYRNNADQVRQMLQEDSSLAIMPFFDHDVEPPLCYAARMGCCQEIVSLLLSSGAQWSDEDKWGRSARELAVIRASPPQVPSAWPAPYGTYFDFAMYAAMELHFGWQ